MSKRGKWEPEERQLFASHARWLVTEVKPGLTRAEAVSFLLKFFEELDTESRGVMRDRWQLKSPAQREGEQALASLLQKHFQVRQRIERRAQYPGRHVDWPGTIVAASPLLPTVYLERPPVSRCDTDLLAALWTTGRHWVRLHRLAGAGADETVELERAMSGIRCQVSAPRPLDWQLRRRLQRAFPDEAEKLNRALRYWREPLKEEDVPGLVDMFSPSDEDAIDLMPNNADNLLELLSKFSIIRAAQSCGWGLRGDPTLLRRDDVRSNNRTSWLADFTLTGNELSCQIGKGVPDSSCDYVSKLRENVTGQNPTGNEPDIVVRFWRNNDEKHSVYVLGDAKRNAKGDVKAYLAESFEIGCVYLVSYGHQADVTLDTEGFHGPIMPAMTLFFLQSVAGFCDSQRENGRQQTIEELAEFFRSCPPDQMPAIAAMELRHLGHQLDDDAPFRAPALEAWFKRLAEACEALLPQKCE